MKKLPNHTALKEWSTVIDSLGRGEQAILLRKGGIADSNFGVEAAQFYLYPTYFHQGENEHRRACAITHWCEVARTWSVRDAGVLDRLAALVSLPRQTIDARYRFRPDQALHIIGVRTFALPAPVEIAFREEYAGCRSWLSIEDEIDVEGSTAVLSEAELEANLGAVESIVTNPSSAFGTVSPQAGRKL